MPAHKPLSLRLRAELFTQLYQMEVAGLPALKAFSVLQVTRANESRLSAMRSLIKRHPLAIAGELSGLFTKLEARLIQASVSAGSPARMYQRLADFYTERALQVATMKSKLAMPAAVFLIALLVAPLPKLASGAIGLFGYLWQVLYPLIAIGLLVVAFRVWMAKRGGVTSALLALPIVGKLIIQQNARDFFECLGLMLEAGISMLDALPLALDAIEVPAMRKEFGLIAPRVTAGATLATAISEMRNTTFLGSTTSRQRVQSFIHTGEASGTLPEMLLRHTAMESNQINDWLTQLAEWAPRILYGMVMIWMIISLISGGGLLPSVPLDLTQ